MNNSTKAYAATCMHEAIEELCKAHNATERHPLMLGNVEFWIDKFGCFAGIVSHDIPVSQWNIYEIAADLNALRRPH